MSQHEPSLTQNTVGALVRMHRVARGLTQQALARLCQLSPISISQIEQGVRIPSVTACRALAAALGCPPRLWVLRVFRATAPAAMQDVLHAEGAMVSDSPTMQEFTPLLRTVQTLPPCTSCSVACQSCAAAGGSRAGASAPRVVGKCVRKYTLSPYPSCFMRLWPNFG